MTNPIQSFGFSEPTRTLAQYIVNTYIYLYIISYTSYTHILYTYFMFL